MYMQQLNWYVLQVGMYVSAVPQDAFVWNLKYALDAMPN